jgi:hypothetical protein
MARNVALVATWSTPVAGREGKALEVFMELMAFWGQKHAEGKCEEPEALFAQDGSNGIFIVRGQSDTLREVEESDEANILQTKAHMIVNDLRTTWYWAGDDEVMRATQNLVQAATDLGYM